LTSGVGQGLERPGEGLLTLSFLLLQPPHLHCQTGLLGGDKSCWEESVLCCSVTMLLVFTAYYASVLSLSSLCPLSVLSLSSPSNNASYLFLAKGWAGGDRIDRGRGVHSDSRVDCFGGTFLDFLGNVEENGERSPQFSSALPSPLASFSSLSSSAAPPPSPPSPTSMTITLTMSSGVLARRCSSAGHSSAPPSPPPSPSLPPWASSAAPSASS